MKTRHADLLDTIRSICTPPKLSPSDQAIILGVSVGAVWDGSVNDPVKLREEQLDWEARMALDDHDYEREDES